MEDKLKKMRNAERQAAYSLKSKKSVSYKFETRGRFKRAKWNENGASSSSSSASVPVNDVKFGGQQLYQPPQRSPPTCYFCQEVGHMVRQGPKRLSKN